MTHLVQILLPLADNRGKPFPDALLRGIQKKLTDTFGGLTAYSRAPAKGIWQGGGGVARDDIVILEVMVEALNLEWWASFRAETERLLDQEKLVVRAQSTQIL